MLKKFFDEKLLKFMLVGVLNTIVGTAIMFSFYNLLHLGYYVSTAANYIITSVMSFFLNKYFTFKSHGHMARSALKFAINIVCCYVLAYGIAKPAAAFLFSKLPLGVLEPIENFLSRFLSGDKAIEENVAMLVGMVLFVVFNYAGQRFFAFKNEE